MARATTPKAVEAEEATETEEVEVAEEAVVEETTVAEVEEVEVAPSTKSFTAPNTWTAYYGNRRYDFIEGKKYDVPADAYAWFTK